jgi:acyl-[acyl-carrier-protein]-phospholipid O-acyltransferase/long-chain-fatty-acid--[acyl-carrier-protein] ligase
LPGINYKLEQVEGISQGGRLWVQGDNVMMGYLKVDQPGVLQATTERWHDTGDIVDIDEEGFISILGRAKRFAKIGGEMVSLTHVEGWITKLWPAGQHCVSAVADARKGEKLVLVTTYQGADRKSMQKYIINEGGAELMVPRDIVYVTEIPLLGSGKLDFPAIQKIANQSA